MQTLENCPPALRGAIDAQRNALLRGAGMGAGSLDQAVEAAAMLGGLTEDATLAGAVLAHAVLARRAPADAAAPGEPARGRGTAVDPPGLAEVVGAEALGLARELVRSAGIGLPPGWSPAQRLDARHAEGLRGMLLAMASDPRLLLARLAEQLAQLRRARELPQGAAARLALESRVLFAPLASRLGVWQLKWELEDLAFRLLEPEEYRRIAGALNERRADRERYIAAVRAELAAALEQAGIRAEVYGRPKHMYSIYRKMQRKQLAFEQLFDVRAVRIVVGSIPECYAALGVVHGLWPYLPGEFDDYIATPKPNGYRSIHTAVTGPQGLSLEVQIRTQEMHEGAELGVAAHWAYKEGATASRNDQRRLELARRLLEPGATVDEAGERDLLEGMREQLFAERVYALTPRGAAIDLPRGATPLDFAYQVHTSLGHRCRGAKVNGRIVPLTAPLHNGAVVEIITGREESPSRDWMAAELGYLVSQRNRTKVRSWFRRQDLGTNIGAGRAIAERELARLAVGPEHLAPLIQTLGARDAEHLYQLIGEGEISGAQLAQAANRLLEPAAPPPAAVPRRRPRAARQRSPVTIEGESDLPVTLAHCCSPLPPQPIVGYVTLGRGVTVHRVECGGLRRMLAGRPERRVAAAWADGAVPDLAVEIAVTAHDRRGLVRDLTDVLAAERLNISELTTTTDRRAARAQVRMGFAVIDLGQLARVLRGLSEVASVIQARRVR